MPAQTLPLMHKVAQKSPERFQKRRNTSSKKQYQTDLALSSVRSALQEKTKGITENFDALIAEFKLPITGDSNTLNSSTLRSWLSALSHVISQIERTHIKLVDAILGLPWTTMDDAFVKSYIDFVGHLVSARPEYLSSVLNHAVDALTYHAELRVYNSSPTEPTRITRHVVYDRIHTLLQHLLSLIPTLPSTLQPILIRCFPHKRQDRVSHVTYLRNMLRLTEYCPALSDRILATVIGGALQIDVEIQTELDELEADHGLNEDGLFNLDPFDQIVGEGPSTQEQGDDSDEIGDEFSDLSSEGGPDLDATTITDVPFNEAQIREMVEKLDAVLNLVFDHFHRTHSLATAKSVRSNSPAPANNFAFPQLSLTPEAGRSIRQAQFSTLLNIFDRLILNTFKSRYTQFLVFWYSSLDPEFTDRFLGLLLSKSLFEIDQPMTTRAAATSYVAGLVSRAHFVDKTHTRRVVGLLCQCLSGQLDGFGTLSISQHAIFYAVAQAVFLIFCFRWRDLVEQDEEDDADTNPSRIPGGKKWLPELDVMKRVILSPLNPLKMCSANVVKQFARVARSTDFLYCYAIIEANRRSEYHSTLPNSSGSQTNQGALPPTALLPILRDSGIDKELNTFFPFDPYKLPQSHSYIEGIYREWASVAIEEILEEDEDEDEDEDEEEDEESESVGSHMVIGSLERWNSTEELGRSFGGMSISPARPPPPPPFLAV